MDIFLTIGKIGSLSVWIIFWLSIIIIFLIKREEFLNFFSGIKKVLSAVIEILVFFAIFNTLLWRDNFNFSIMNYLSVKSAYVLIFIGYVFILVGFLAAMKAIWPIGSQLPENTAKIDLFKHQRNLAYRAFLFIAVGSSLALINTASFIAIIIILIPLLAYRVKVENEANYS